MFYLSISDVCLKYSDMKKIILILSLFLSRLTFAQTGWLYQNPNPLGVSVSNEHLQKVTFTDNLHGFIAGLNGTFLKTDNGGTTWDTSKIGTKDFYSICFINNNTGWIGGFQSLYKTTNSGINWVNQFSGSTGITDISFINSETGWFTSSPTGIFKTTNGGNNWLNVFSGPSSYRKLTFIDSQTGWAAYRNASPDVIIKTTNGGMNWVEIEILENARTINFVNANTGFIFSSGWFHKTTNGGMNWAAAFTNWSNWEMNDAYFLNANIGYCVNFKGQIYKTSNGGNNWDTLQKIITSGSISSIYFKSENTGWAVGGYGTILKTTTGGNVFVEQISSILPDKFSLHQNYPNPFNPSTTISFQIPKGDFVSLKVYDINGREVSELVNENLQAGEYKINFNGSNLPSGVYYYKLTSENFAETKKMILIK